MGRSWNGHVLVFEVGVVEMCMRKAENIAAPRCRLTLVTLLLHHSFVIKAT
jgi:hypothetical protein